MTRDEYNNAVEDIIQMCQDRNSTFAFERGTVSGPQPFESKNLNAVLEDALEEVLDLINYGVQAALKLKSLQRSLA